MKLADAMRLAVLTWWKTVLSASNHAAAMRLPAARCCSRRIANWKRFAWNAISCTTNNSSALKYAEIVYYGLWFTPLREALDAFVEQTQKEVSGTVTLKLYKGNVTIGGRESEYSLYRTDLSSFTMSESYDQKDAEGFIRILGLPARSLARLKQRKLRRQRSEDVVRPVSAAAGPAFRRVAAVVSVRPEAAALRIGGQPRARAGAESRGHCYACGVRVDRRPRWTRSARPASSRPDTSMILKLKTSITSWRKSWWR